MTVLTWVGVALAGGLGAVLRLLVDEAVRARRPGGACSTAIRAAPPHSPPADRPCSSRSATSRIGAATPIVA